MLSLLLACVVDCSMGGLCKDSVGHSKLQGSFFQKERDSAVLYCTTLKQDLKPGSDPSVILWIFCFPWTFLMTEEDSISVISYCLFSAIFCLSGWPEPTLSLPFQSLISIPFFPSVLISLLFYLPSFSVLAAIRWQPVLCQQCWQMQLLLLEQQITSICNHVGDTFFYIC